MATRSAAAPPAVRLRLVFDRSRLLRRAQRDDGLRRCWLLLRPELATVADLAAHVSDRFRLGRSCPSGVVLSMDGFTLPPFESSSIFRDKDIVRVKQKSYKNMIKHDDVHCVQDPLVVENLPLTTDDNILAIDYKKDDNKHQEEQEGGNQDHENATIGHNIQSNSNSLKRKCRNDAGIPETESSRKKKVKDVGPSKEANLDEHEDQNGSKNLVSSVTKKAAPQAENTVVSKGKQKIDMNRQTELNCETKVADGNTQNDTKKLESRSARRKKLKRRLRQEAKPQSEKSIQEESPKTADCPSSSNQFGFSCPPDNQNGFCCLQGNQNDSHVPSTGHKTDEESDSSEDIVPIVVRPGHIRFGRAGGEQEKSLAIETQGTFQWNGTMSKKKGQKWGMNNTKYKNVDVNYDARIAGSSLEAGHHVADSMITENGSCGASNQKVEEGSISNSASVKTIADKEKSSGGPLDFESLFPLTRLPKEGDLIAYRLVELSSSWCPELSSYRVGKVLIYDPISLRIILLPVPEHPIIREERKIEDEPDMLVDMSPYKEDGSLEIDYSSLLDVRLLQGNESTPAAVRTPSAETGKNISLAKTPNTLDKSNGNIDSQKALLGQNNTASQATQEWTQKTVWEETGDVPNDKSDVQENGWGNWTPNASTSAWSLRALRSSAIGPTVAILRGKNNQRGKPSNRKHGK